MPARGTLISASRPVRRETAERYVLLTLLSFAASVSLTRLGLALTGYPQLGGGELHIAHVLWGGLLLFAAALLPLVLANRWVFTAGALLAGVGVGLFIDEVGKFITQRNDYFFPAAAPIVYTFFLLTILLFVHIRRTPDDSPHAELHRALGDIREMLEEPITPGRNAQLRSRLDRIASKSPNPGHVDLAKSLMRFVENEQQEAARPPKEHPADAALSGLQRFGQRIPPNTFRTLLAIGILSIGLLTLKNPTHVLLDPWLPQGIHKVMESLYAGRQIDPASAPSWFTARVVLEVVLGTFFLLSAGLVAAGRKKWGSILGIGALLLSLTTVNLLLFYFEQFSTVITTVIQFLLLLGLLYWRQSTTTT
jgi:hypothetical protein